MKSGKTLLIAFVTALVAAGCAGGASDTTASSAQGAPAPAERNAEGGGSGDSGAAAAQPRQPGQPGQQVKLNPDAGARAVIYTATLGVRAKDVDRAAAQAKRLVTAAGGHVQSESAGDSGRTTLTFKIPAERYTATLEALSTRLGTRLSLSQQAEDVTEEVADVDSRVRSAEATLASFRKLLERANTVGEVISVEQEIARRQADLESLQARQKSLAEQTRYATVTLELARPSAAVKDTQEHGGFLGGLERGWDGLVALGSGVALAAGVLLPFAVVAAVLALIALSARKALRARRAAG